MHKDETMKESNYLDLESFEEEKLDRFKLGIYPVDTRLQDYEGDWDRGYLFIPEFQRQYVWNKTDASKFVESILLGLPIPNIFLYQEQYASKNIVIDGHQRIVTVVSFIKGNFIRGKNEGKQFNIAGTRGRWEGKSYKDLDEKTKFTFDNYVMRATVIQQLAPEGSDSSMYEIFERLNTGGKALNAMEVRMCVGLGNFTRLLSKLNEMPKWKKLFGRKEDSKRDLRSKDIELILRFFALHDRKYMTPMKNFLTSYVLSNKDASQKWLEEKEELFKKVVDRALALGEKPFHLSQRLNISVFDSIMVALASSNVSDEKVLKNLYAKLLENREYMEIVHVGRGTTETSLVRGRIQIAKEVFNNG